MILKRESIQFKEDRPCLRIAINYVRHILQLSHLYKYISSNEHLYADDDNGKFIIYPHLLRESIDLSHLCHNSDCVEDSHVIWEPHIINMIRNACILLGYCQGHYIGDVRLPDCLPCGLKKTNNNTTDDIDE